MRKLYFIFVLLWVCGFGAVARADTYQLNDGNTLNGDIVSFNENGMILRLPDQNYSDRVPWSKFSQPDLKKFAENPKMAPLVEPFIEVSAEERIKMTEVKINPVPRLERPAAHSLVGAMFSSSVGIFVMLCLYLANLYAAYEIAIFRARPIGLVCGVSAVAPIIGPIAFLSMGTQLDAPVEEDEGAKGPAVIQPFAAPPSRATAAPQAGSHQAPHGDADNPMAGDVEPPKGLHLHVEPSPSTSQNLPQTQVFPRGAFTFNRRFFETKFPGFFPAVRRDSDKDMVLDVKSARGQYVAQRITRISGHDVHFEVHKGHASEEVMVPFSEIQEIRLKHKDAA